MAMKVYITKQPHTYSRWLFSSAGYTFDHRDPGSTTNTTCAQALIDYLGKIKKVNYSGVKRIGVKRFD
jgi:hypothetical protein